MSAEPAGPTQPTPPHPAATPGDSPRRTLVLFLIAATALLFLALFTVLYLRWSGAQEPSSAIVVSTTPAFEGAELIVEGIALPEPYHVTVGKRSGRDVPFYLDRGSYTLRIVFGDRTIYTADFALGQNEWLKFDLSRLEHILPSTTTAPTAAAPFD
jgi:hypothetical protein